MPSQPPTFRTTRQAAQAEASAREFDRRRLAETQTKRLYSTARWRARREACRASAKGLCQACRREGRVVEGNTADHKDPHRGDPGKFWNGELEWLCAPCHSSAKQREENEARGGRGVKNPEGDRR